MNRKEN